MFVSQHDCALPGFAGQEGYSQSDDTFWKVPIVSEIKNWRLYRHAQCSWSKYPRSTDQFIPAFSDRQLSEGDGGKTWRD